MSDTDTRDKRLLEIGSLIRECANKEWFSKAELTGLAVAVEDYAVLVGDLADAAKKLSFDISFKIASVYRADVDDALEAIDSASIIPGGKEDDS